MSRLARKPIPIPPGVTISLQDSTLTVSGKLGTLTRTLAPEITVQITPSGVMVLRPDDEKSSRAIQGLTWRLIRNMIQGVTEGFMRALEINGPGYKASVQGNTLILSVGFIHPLEYSFDPSLKIAVKENRIEVFGIDKEKVGHTSAEIRSLRPVEPYKERGIKYVDEKVRRKVSKAAKIA